MKKYIAFLLCLMMILSLVSCDFNNDQDDLSSNENGGLSDLNNDSINDNITSPSEAEKAMQVYPITSEQAWNLANAYWDNQDGSSDCAAGTIFTARIVLIDTPNPDANYYRFAFQVEWYSSGGIDGYESMPPYHINIHDQILVNAFTGEITASTYDPNGKIISIEEAIEIAKNHETYMSGEMCSEENGYTVEHTPNIQTPDHVYVIVIRKHDIVYGRIWIDKYTGEIIFPYYMYGKG